MKVRLLVSRTGPAGAFNVGHEMEVSEAEGTRLVEAGQAAPIADEPPKFKRSKAVVEPKETRGKR